VPQSSGFIGVVRLNGFCWSSKISWLVRVIQGFWFNSRVNDLSNHIGFIEVAVLSAGWWHFERKNIAISLICTWIWVYWTQISERWAKIESKIVTQTYHTLCVWLVLKVPLFQIPCTTYFEWNTLDSSFLILFIDQLTSRLDSNLHISNLHRICQNLHSHINPLIYCLAPTDILHHRPQGMLIFSNQGSYCQNVSKSQHGTTYLPCQSLLLGYQYEGMSHGLTLQCGCCLLGTWQNWVSQRMSPRTNYCRYHKFIHFSARRDQEWFWGCANWHVLVPIGGTTFDTTRILCPVKTLSEKFKCVPKFTGLNFVKTFFHAHTANTIRIARYIYWLTWGEPITWIFARNQLRMCKAYSEHASSKNWSN
jgi:hypothetical protein